MQNSQESLSYKFQRLRERIRQAIQNGELSGKLPGERELARRFQANPKTLSKALTDLAAEGLLERSIGRGTFVHGTAPAAELAGRWLIVCDPDQAQSPVIRQIQNRRPDAEVATDAAALRPSYISQFSSVIDMLRAPNERFHRSLLVRGMSVVLIDREPSPYKVHAVVLDRAHAVSCLARDLFLAGHRRVLVVEEAGSTVASAAVRTAAARYAPHAAVDSCTPRNADSIVDRSNTAILCNGETAVQAVEQLAQEHPHLAHAAVAAVGITDGAPSCTGIYTSPAEIAQAAVGLLQSGQIHRPTVLWLAGTYIERGTILAIPEARFEMPAATQPRALSA